MFVFSVAVLLSSVQNRTASCYGAKQRTAEGFRSVHRHQRQRMSLFGQTKTDTLSTTEKELTKEKGVNKS